MLSQMETKHNQKIKDMAKTYHDTQQELVAKNKQLERDNKVLNEKLEISYKG